MCIDCKGSFEGDEVESDEPEVDEIEGDEVEVDEVQTAHDCAQVCLHFRVRR